MRGPPEAGRAVKCGLRIAQGGLANVREHSGATTAALTLTSLDDQVVLDIADDGRGFDPERPAARSSVHGQDQRGEDLREEDPRGQDRRGEDLLGHGLPPIRARARQLGGTLTVESAPGRGTVLSVSAPIDGVETTRRITSAAVPSGGPHVLVLTTYDTDADITRAIEAGATGYLLKAVRPDELFDAIHAAAQGRTALSPPVASRVVARMRSPRPSLTPRELDILGQLAHGLGNRDIARALFISEATVKTHLGRIYSKLGVETRAGAVATAKEQRLIP
ncbi:LuxR C-terminal-related transcriptional regulator [Streptomyces sp. NBC_00963]|uniref:LuxR C-terminal-related transcriptional regulator n=1 Tax=Streptomyces sp. NBC_00963 TaxID=2903697 RepID=UPI00386A4419|nr:LuxR C-terminal-related transcriptional regulator [Streptomyces sp. NBC_00963]